MDEEQETRYYALSGQAAVLDRVENVLRFVERAGECGVIRLISVFVDGREGARVQVRILASRRGTEEAGSGLPPIADENLEQAHYVMDVVMPRD
jgi:hypothetical protein